jgi:hypothetical protein
LVLTFDPFWGAHPQGLHQNVAGSHVQYLARVSVSDIALKAHIYYNVRLQGKMVMRQGWYRLALAVFAVTAGANEGATQGLGQTLEVQVTQSGFAGETGRLWIIQPDGKWIVRRVGPGAPQEPVATGSLTETQVAELRTQLERSDFQSLPNSFGESVQVNPHRLVIRWGGREVMLTSPPGENPIASTPVPSTPQTQRQRAAAIAREVQRLTAE